MTTDSGLEQAIEAILFAAGKPISIEHLQKLFPDRAPALGELRQALADLQAACVERGVELIEVASGFQFKVKQEYVPWVSRLWEEKPPKYSRALYETLALIAYRQPITRGEIEDIRGVSISASIFKTLLEDRGWIRLVGHKNVPGKPGLYATTKEFLDYFGVRSLEDLPSLPEILNMGEPEAQQGEMAMGEPVLSQQIESQADAAEEGMLSDEVEQNLEVADAEEDSLMEEAQVGLEDETADSMEDEELTQQADEFSAVVEEMLVSDSIAEQDDTFNTIEDEVEA